MSNETKEQGDGVELRGRTNRPLRADARRNTDALLEAALAVFATSGADASVREIALKAALESARCTAIFRSVRT